MANENYKIMEAFCASLSVATLTGAPPISWPNVSFSPPKSGYLSVFHLPAQTSALTLTQNNLNRLSGLFQVNINTPENEGFHQAYELAGEIMSLFKAGSALSNGGFNFWISRPPFISPPVFVSPFWQVIVSVPYEGEAAND